MVEAKAAGVAEVSGEALLKRLRKAEDGLRELCLTLLRENQVSVAAREPSRVLRLVDAPVVKEPGPTGRLWRLHYSLQVPGLGCDFFALTPTAGAGESFRRFPVSAEDYILGDAGYCTPTGVEPLSRQGAYGLGRFNGGSLPLESRDASVPCAKASRVSFKPTGACDAGPARPASRCNRQRSSLRST